MLTMTYCPWSQTALCHWGPVWARASPTGPLWAWWCPLSHSAGRCHWRSPASTWEQITLLKIVLVKLSGLLISTRTSVAHHKWKCALKVVLLINGKIHEVVQEVNTSTDTQISYQLIQTLSGQAEKYKQGFENEEKLKILKKQPPVKKKEALMAAFQWFYSYTPSLKTCRWSSRCCL